MIGIEVTRESSRIVGPSSAGVGDGGLWFSDARRGRERPAPRLPKTTRGAKPSGGTGARRLGGLPTETAEAVGEQLVPDWAASGMLLPWPSPMQRTG